MLDKVGPGYRGRDRRVAVTMPGTLVEADGCAIDVDVLDVSSSGFRVETNAELVIGETVELRMARSQPLRAVICWTRGEEAGGIFLDPAEALK